MKNGTKTKDKSLEQNLLEIHKTNRKLSDLEDVLMKAWNQMEGMTGSDEGTEGEIAAARANLGFAIDRIQQALVANDAHRLNLTEQDR